MFDLVRRKRVIANDRFGNKVIHIKVRTRVNGNRHGIHVVRHRAVRIGIDKGKGTAKVIGLRSGGSRCSGGHIFDLHQAVLAGCYGAVTVNACNILHGYGPDLEPIGTVNATFVFHNEIQAHGSHRSRAVSVVNRKALFKFLTNHSSFLGEALLDTVVRQRCLFRQYIAIGIGLLIHCFHISIACSYKLVLQGDHGVDQSIVNLNEVRMRSINHKMTAGPVINASVPSFNKFSNLICHYSSTSKCGGQCGCICI